MATIPNFYKDGWVKDPQRVQAVIQAREAAGQLVMGSAYAGANQPSLPGTWQRMKQAGVKGVFLRDAEPSVYGSYLRAMLQRFGTCVSRGTARGVQTSLTTAIKRLKLLRPIIVAFAPIYSMARHECGHDRCGSGDGAILADAMNAIHNLGVATLELFEGMTEDQIERQAVHFAAPGVGTPQAWKDAAQGHTCVTYWPDTLDLLFDSIASGNAVPYAHGRITGSPNKDGISGLGSQGAHCRCYTGVFVDQSGNDQLLSSESWGAFPARQPMDEDQTMPVDQIPRITLHYGNNETKILAPGEVGVNAHDFWGECQNNGEAWAVGAPLFKANGVAETLIKPKLP